jgi:hypothetical protein
MVVSSPTKIVERRMERNMVHLAWGDRVADWMTIQHQRPGIVTG